MIDIFYFAAEAEMNFFQMDFLNERKLLTNIVLKCISHNYKRNRKP